MKKLQKLLPILVIVILMILFFVFDLQRFFTFEELKQKHMMLKQNVADHPILSASLLVGIYIISIALSLPIAGILSLAMGFLFPFPLSTLFVVVGATIGACLIFLSAKTALRAYFFPKVEPFLKKIEPEMHSNAFLYLLTLRFIPLVPFWLLNLAPAFLNVSLKVFTIATFLGIIPGSLVFTYAGNSLNSIFESEEKFSFGTIFTPEIQIAFGILIIFSVIPIIIKKLRKK